MNIKMRIRNFITLIPFGRRFLKSQATLKQRILFLRFRDAQTVFQSHYQNNAWGNAESISGPGSTLAYTVNIREKLPDLIQKLEIKSLLDAPCGDYNWMKEVAWRSDITYIGADIVEDIIINNRARHGGDKRDFIVLDITHAPLPPSELWLCRDCLFHLSNIDIFLTLNNFTKSSINYILTSNHPACDENYNIPTGSFRFLNLRLPPFCLPAPILEIDDWIEGHPIRHLALWKRQTLVESLRYNPHYRKICGIHQAAYGSHSLGGGSGK